MVINVLPKLTKFCCKLFMKITSIYDYAKYMWKANIYMHANGLITDKGLQRLIRRNMVMVAFMFCVAWN